MKNRAVFALRGGKLGIAGQGVKNHDGDMTLEKPCGDFLNGWSFV